MPQATKPYIIGITGSIGSGKSTAARFLKKKGFLVYSADEIVHDLYKTTEVISALMAAFGDDIAYRGQISRSHLGERVFQDREALARLNKILHPRVLERLDNLVDSCHNDTLVLEIPLLFELRLEQCVDLAVLITCQDEVRIPRLIKRDALPEAAIRKRIAAQMPEAAKRLRADYIIHNDKGEGSFRNDIETLISRISAYPPRSNRKSFTVSQQI